jgi:hypothetical protein
MSLELHLLLLYCSAGGVVLSVLAPGEDGVPESAGARLAAAWSMQKAYSVIETFKWPRL